MATIPESEMPAPRLELRWEPLPEDSELREGGYTVVCRYNFVFPLDKYDIRAEYHGPRGGHKYGHHKTKTVELGVTRSTGNSPQYSAELDDVGTPFRDGAHINWDAQYFGNPPMFAVAEGRAMRIAPWAKEGK